MLFVLTTPLCFALFFDFFCLLFLCFAFCMLFFVFSDLCCLLRLFCNTVQVYLGLLKGTWYIRIAKATVDYLNIYVNL